ncbi:uncharacterized protein Dana_GF11446 [Drosophila ananassae]|uniref:Uncharacterized protein n=1 Tax=Drosophila ananassae TaxID=7217 RepID=B3MD49_DROAN|nr:collagen alpha-1(III) chain [Drosophila ananassae]EDV37382.2 uncharacterized protein Dana_GF11446 [Drosophila ananassae]
MSSQFLSLGWVLALTMAFFGQRAGAYPQNPFYVEGSGESGPRGHGRHHHGHHDHGYHNNKNWPGYGPVGVPQPQLTGYFPRNPYNQVPGGYRPDQQPGNFGNRQPDGFYGGGHGFRPHYGHGYGSGGNFNRGQPGFEFPQQGPNYPPPGGFPPPGSGESFNPRQPGFNQPAYPRPGQLPGNSPTYPRPDYFPGGFQQPESEENSGPSQPGFQFPGGNRGQSGNQQPDANSSPTYPRPGGFRQPDSEDGIGSGQIPGGNRGQPGGRANQQPGGNSSPNYPQPGSGGSTFQPAGSGEKNFQQPLPNPNQAPGGLPSRGQTPGNPKTLQPRPGNDDDFSQFNFQTPNTLQPRPGQDEFAGRAGSPGNTLQPVPGAQQPQGTAIQPRPGQNSNPVNVESTLNDLFKTQEFLSPELSRPEGSGVPQADPKLDATDINPQSVNERNLFDTEPKCKDGTELMSNRCRKTA